MTKITIRRPDDWHVHLRDANMLRAVLPFTAQNFGRAIVMPNLRDPVTTTARAQEYRDTIKGLIDPSWDFTPLMTIYLTDNTNADDIAKGHAAGIITAAKLYPANATTNSSHGVTDINKLAAVFSRMEKIGMPLLIHGEVTDANIDIFDREAVFIERFLIPLRRDFPELKIVLEHITTREGVDWVRDNKHTGHVAATITAHHLRLNRNALFQGGIRPHHWCLPVLKRETHRLALIDAATSGEGCFFLGTDSAPHPRTAKESACGCAGLFTAPIALQVYAEAFFQEDKISNLEKFASINGATFYGLEINNKTLTLERTAPQVPPVKSVLTIDGVDITVFDDESAGLWSIA